MIYSFQSPEVDRPRHRESGVVGHRRRRGGLDRRRSIDGRQAHRQCGRGDLADGAHRRTRSAGSSVATTSRRHAEAEPGVALQILTSGTTGPPKRQSIKTAGAGAHGLQRDQRREAAPPGAPPEFSYWQFGGIGVCQLVAGAYNAQADRHARAVHRRRLGECGEDARHHPLGRAAGGVPHAARRRRAQGRPGFARLPDQRVGSAGSRDSRRVRGALRYSGPVGLRRNGIRWLALRVDARSHRRIRYGQTQQRRQGAAGYPTAHRRPGHRRRAAHRRAGPVGGEDHLDRRRLDPHHRHRLDRRGRVRHAARQGRRGDQPRRIQDPAGNRSARADFASVGSRRVRGGGAGHAPRPGAVRRHRSRAGRAGAVRGRAQGPRPSSSYPCTTCLSRSPSSTNCRATRR